MFLVKHKKITNVLGIHNVWGDFWRTDCMLYSVQTIG